MTDIETGLPELPEGFFWRIRNAQRPLYDWFRSTTYVDVYDEFVLCVMKTGYVKPGTRVIPGKWYWPFPKTEDDSRQVPAQEVYIEKVYGEPTPEAFRDTAQVLLKRFEDARLRERLLGDYPPKKLED